VKVIRKRLFEQEGLPFNVRWSDDCDCVQSFFNGEWVDNPTADPRYNPGNLAPPNPGIDPRCLAAAGMMEKTRAIMDAFFLAQSLIEAANAVLALITVTLPGVGLIWRVVIAVIEALIAVGSAALFAAFTEDAYEQLQCIFYDEIGDDGQMTADQLSTINTRICDEMSSVVCAAMGLILNMQGFVGMSNAGAFYDGEADCSECPIYWCYDYNMLTSDGDFEPRLSPPDWGGVWTSGTGWHNPSATSLNIGKQLPNDVHVTRLGFSSTAYGATAVACYENADYTGVQYFRVNSNDSGDINVFCPAGSWLVCINGSSTDYPFQQYRDITAVHVQGTDEEPFGDSTC